MTTVHHPASSPRGVRVVVFSGGRGSSVLSHELLRNPAVTLTVAVNGYDDGASTGEIRRFLTDSVGPSDFRKNASRFARALRSCPAVVADLLDLRLPPACSASDARQVFDTISGGARAASSGPVQRLAAGLPPATRHALRARLGAFEQALSESGRTFAFGDCALGNLVWAGSFLTSGRRANAAVADYCALLALPEGLLENVSDGTNAYLVAVDAEGRLLGSEEEIVDQAHPNRVRDIFLVDRPLTNEEREGLRGASASVIAAFCAKRAPVVRVNPRLVERLREADVIIYSPGTQHSSLFPSYLTVGLSEAIAGNLQAVKLLVTNLQPDAEIAGSSAVDIIERAEYYLKGKGRLELPTPFLITHYLINDPGRLESRAPYVPLGRLDSLEDPRLARITNYEDGVTGRHDAEKVLTPFIESFLARRRQRVALILYDSESAPKLVQTVLEMVRGGIDALPVDLTIFTHAAAPLPPAAAGALPYQLRSLDAGGQAGQPASWRDLRAEGFDYVLLFESSGMYNGEDIVELASHLTFGRLDSVWGSRRLSVRDIHESYRLRYRHDVLLGAMSYLGSHLLSLAYLVAYGRYVSDTLSGARAVRTAYLETIELAPMHKQLNHRLLSRLLRDRAELLEVPVRFLPLSPARVRRTTVLDGLKSLATVLTQRLRRRPAVSGLVRQPRPVPVQPSSAEAAAGATDTNRAASR